MELSYQTPFYCYLPWSYQPYLPQYIPLIDPLGWLYVCECPRLPPLLNLDPVHEDEVSHTPDEDLDLE